MFVARSFRSQMALWFCGLSLGTLVCVGAYLGHTAAGRNHGHGAGDIVLQQFAHVLHRADQALYQAKDQGRNRTVLWAPAAPNLKGNTGQVGTESQ